MREDRGQRSAAEPWVAVNEKDPNGSRLNVDLQAADRGEGVAHSLPHRGMRVNHVHHVVDASFQIQHGSSFRENFRGQRADDVNAENFSVLLLGNDLDEAAVIAENGGLAVSHERKLADLNSITRVTRLLFSHADRANLRLAVGGIRDAELVDGVRGFAGDVSDSDDAFHHRGVCQLRKSGYDVTDSVKAWFIGFHPLVHLDKS